MLQLADVKKLSRDLIYAAVEKNVVDESAESYAPCAGINQNAVFALQYVPKHSRENKMIVDAVKDASSEGNAASLALVRRQEQNKSCRVSSI